MAAKDYVLRSAVLRYPASKKEALQDSHLVVTASSKKHPIFELSKCGAKILRSQALR